MMETVLLLQIVVMLWGSGLGASISPEFYKRVITLPNRVFNGVRLSVFFSQGLSKQIFIKKIS